MDLLKFELAKMGAQLSEENEFTFVCTYRGRTSMVTGAGVVGRYLALSTPGQRTELLRSVSRILLDVGDGGGPAPAGVTSKP